MFTAILLTLSTIALVQFAVCYWRAVIVSVAAEPISEDVMAAAGLGGRVLRAGDFSTLAGLHEVTPMLQIRSGRREGALGFGMVSVYYNLVGALARLARPFAPAMAVWSDHEQAACSRYAANLLDHRMRNNQACLAGLRSF